MNAISCDLNDYNLYVHHLQDFSITWHHNPIAISALELFDASPSSDFTAIMHINDCVGVKPWSVVIWHNSENDPSFIPHLQSSLQAFIICPSFP